MPADRAETLTGQRDQLGGALRRDQQHQDGRAGRAEQRAQRLGGGRPAGGLGQRARARVHHRVPVRLVPGDPAGRRGHRHEEELRAGDLPRRVLVGVDLQAALAQPAQPRAHVGQRLGPAAAAELRGASHDVRLNDLAAFGPVRPDGVRPHPLQQVGCLARQIIGVPLDPGSSRSPATKSGDRLAICASSSPKACSSWPAGATVMTPGIQQRASERRISQGTSGCSFT